MSRVWGGIAYPWGETLRSFAEDKSDENVLKTSILNILLTQPGERVMNPTFGSALIERIFGQNDAALAAEVQSIVQDTVKQWDDRIEVEGVKISADENQMNVQVIYKNIKDPLEESVQILNFSLTPDTFG